MYKVGQTLGYVTERRNTEEKLIRLTVTDIIFNQSDETMVDKYNIDFREEGTERQYDCLYWYPDVHPTIEAFVDALEYDMVPSPREEDKMMVTIPMGELVITRHLDPHYPGVLIDLHDQYGEEIQLALIEYNADKGLRGLLWSDLNQEDYTHDVRFNALKKNPDVALSSLDSLARSLA